jgi:hypothetical protein
MRERLVEAQRPVNHDASSRPISAHVHNLEISAPHRGIMRVWANTMNWEKRLPAWSAAAIYGTLVLGVLAAVVLTRVPAGNLQSDIVHMAVQPE